MFGKFSEIGLDFLQKSSMMACLTYVLLKLVLILGQILPVGLLACRRGKKKAHFFLSLELRWKVFEFTWALLKYCPPHECNKKSEQVMHQDKVKFPPIPNFVGR